MSEQEEASRIGTLVRERVDAKRQFALLRHDVEQVADQLSTLGACMRTPDAVTEWNRGMTVLNALLKDAGLEGLKSKALELGRLGVRINEITATLRDAGIE